MTATTLPPKQQKEAAIVGTLVPGAYTAIVRGAGDTTGVALVEAYGLGTVPISFSSLLVDTVIDPKISLGTVVFGKNGELGIWQKVTKDTSGNVTAQTGFIACDTKTNLSVDASSDPTTNALKSFRFSDGTELVIVSSDSVSRRVAVYVNGVKTDEVTIAAKHGTMRASAETAAGTSAGWFQEMHSTLEALNDMAVVLDGVNTVIGSKIPKLVLNVANLERIGGVVSLGSFVATKIAEGTTAEIPVRTVGVAVGLGLSVMAATSVAGPVTLAVATLAIGNEIYDIVTLLFLQKNQVDADNQARELLREYDQSPPDGECLTSTSHFSPDCQPCGKDQYNLFERRAEYFDGLKRFVTKLTEAVVLTRTSPDSSLRAATLAWGNREIFAMEIQRSVIANQQKHLSEYKTAMCLAAALGDTNGYRACMQPTYDVLTKNALSLDPIDRELAALIARYQAAIDPIK